MFRTAATVPVIVLAALAWTVQATVSAGAAAPPPSASSSVKAIPKRNLSFSLETEAVSGTVPFGSELSLGVFLSGGVATTDQLVAVVEGASLDTIMVPMEPVEGATQWKAVVAIKPKPLGYTSVRPKALRLRVTVSQVKQSGLARLIGRSAYVTLTHDEPELPPPGTTPAEGESVASEGDVEIVTGAVGSTSDEVQPDVAPVTNVLIAEEDLKPLPESKDEQGYWKEVARLISRSWGQRVRYVKGLSTAKETVRVRFQMHANGEAQLIQIERTSGVRDVDEAGLLAIVHAHPFPSFRDWLGDGVIEVHVRMRTGARPTAVVQDGAVAVTPGKTSGDTKRP
ncbi:MAG: TonB C-terminal domain-containing protein [Nitrospiraceae bacterium]